VRPEGLGPLKKSPHRVSNPRQKLTGLGGSVHRTWIVTKKEAMYSNLEFQAYPSDTLQIFSLYAILPQLQISY
jgi:hypothetical protein